MSNHLFSNLLFKVFPIVILMSVNSGCTTKEQNYGAILDARLIPTSVTELADECKWINEELAVIEQKIVTINTTKGLAALKSATAIDKQKYHMTLLNTRATDIGCLELTNQPVQQ